MARDHPLRTSTLRKEGLTPKVDIGREHTLIKFSEAMVITHLGWVDIDVIYGWPLRQGETDRV